MSNCKYSPHKLVWHPDKLKALADGRVSAPIYVRIKPTNRCTHACRFCVYGHGDYHGVMHAGMAQAMRDELPYFIAVGLIHDLARIGVKAVTFSGGGEPLIYGHIAELIGQANNAGIATSVITNGQAMNGEVAYAMIGCAWTRVSIDYWDAASFTASRGVREEGFHTIVANIKRFAARPGRGDLGVNFIITRENHAHLEEVTRWLRDLGVDHIRFSPVWKDDFFEYHQEIEFDVAMSLGACRKQETERFKVFDSYKIAPSANQRPYSKCWFQQVVPVVGADQRVYTCHNGAHSDKHCIGSIQGRSFSDLWFSPETAEFFKSFDAKCRCANMQYAADAKQKIITELIDARGDSFV